MRYGKETVVQTAKTLIIGFTPKLWFGAVFEGTVV
jgi:hypothetical protein